MWMFRQILCWILLTTGCWGHFSRVDTTDLKDNLMDISLEDLELRRDTIRTELSQLARLSMNSGVGRIGYRSASHGHAESEEWIWIEFDKPYPIDSIILIPVIWRDADVGFVADGFPQAFQVEFGVDTKDPGQLLAQFDEPWHILPRTSPFVIDAGGQLAQWVRIKATRLSPRHFDDQYVLQFAEVCVFSASKNIAMSRPVLASTASIAGSGAWHPDFLVDSMTPYLMDAAGGGGSLAFANEAGFTDKPSLVIDLGEPYMVDELILHVIEQTDTVPQAFPGDYGVPFQFVLEGAQSDDFSDAVILFQFSRDSIFAVSPIMSFRLPESTCRYIRLTALEPYVFRGREDDMTPIANRRLGFAEIEVLSAGKNVALNRPVQINFEPGRTVRRIETLTDGKNLYGEILPIKDWLNQLAERHDLETELPLINSQLALRYDQQKENLYWLKLSLGMMGTVVVISVLIIRTRQQQLIYRTRERITADLHDVLGGNISAIALLGQVAQRDLANPELLSGYLRRIENLAGRTRNALKYITDMLNESGLYQNLLQEMRRIGEGLTEGIEHEFICTGEENIARIAERRRADVFLFYKECLVNIIRHARATRIETYLLINVDRLQLTVADNGIGLPREKAAVVPRSLRRRARILGATVSVGCASDGGTLVHMMLKHKRPVLQVLFSRLSAYFSTF
jgi:signal transduction histidine kinase